MWYVENLVVKTKQHQSARTPAVDDTRYKANGGSVRARSGQKRLLRGCSHRARSSGLPRRSPSWWRLLSSSTLCDDGGWSGTREALNHTRVAKCLFSGHYHIHATHSDGVALTVECARLRLITSNIIALSRVLCIRDCFFFFNIQQSSAIKKEINFKYLLILSRETTLKICSYIVLWVKCLQWWVHFFQLFPFFTKCSQNCPRYFPLWRVFVCDLQPLIYDCSDR